MLNGSGGVPSLMTRSSWFSTAIEGGRLASLMPSGRSDATPFQPPSWLTRRLAAFCRPAKSSLNSPLPAPLVAMLDPNLQLLSSIAVPLQTASASFSDPVVPIRLFLASSSTLTARSPAPPASLPSSSHASLFGSSTIFRQFARGSTLPCPPFRPLLHKRFFFSRFRRNLTELEAAADAHPQDPKKQAALYQELVAVEPDTLIRRFESGKYARDTTCTIHYLCALYETSQLDRAVPYFLLPTKPNMDRSGSAAASSGPSTFTSASSPDFVLPQQSSPLGGAPLMLGTKEKPLYVFAASAGSNAWARRLVSFLNFAIVAAILYSLVAFNEHRLGGISTKVHKLFQKDQSGGKVYTFDDVQGCDDAKQELQEVVEFLKNPDKFNKLGAKMPKGILLVGPPGTGKTLLAKAVAGEAEVPFIYASGSEFDELFVGIGSMRIRQMFESAKEQAPAIIFIDEIDAVGSKRNARDPQHSRMSLNQLLIELDGFSETQGIVVIAATNFPETLDKALLRPGRFDRHVHVPLPDVRGRRQILDMYLRDVAVSSDVDTQVMARATPGFSGADLFKVINQAKIMASVENGYQVTMEHLERSKDEMILGTERKSAVIGDEERRLTAYHESGHAIVAFHTPYANPIHKATIIPRGKSLGMVAQLPEKDELSFSKMQLLARMDVAMGGRIAEELMFGPEFVTTGASSDFTQATAIARGMVTQYGMSDKLGPVVIDEEDWDNISPETRSLIDSEVKALLEASRLRALSIIQKHQDELKRLAAALLEYETLNIDEIKVVLSGQSIREAGLDLLF